MSEKAKMDPSHKSESIPDGSPILSFDINIGRRLPQGQTLEVDYGKLNRIAGEQLSTEEIENLGIEVTDKIDGEFATDLGSRAIRLPLKGLDSLYPYALAIYADELHDTPNARRQTPLGAIGETARGLLSRPSRAIVEDPFTSGILIANPAMLIAAAQGLPRRTEGEVNAEKFMRRHKGSGTFRVPNIAPYTGRHRQD